MIWFMVGLLVWSVAESLVQLAVSIVGYRRSVRELAARDRQRGMP